MIKDDFTDTQRSEPVGNLPSKYGGLFASHHNQGQRWSRRVRYFSQGMPGSKANGIHRRANARCGRISAAAAAVAVRLPGGIQHDGARAGTAGVQGEKEGFQFGLIGCREES